MKDQKWGDDYAKHFAFVLGLDDENMLDYLETERHAITIAGAGSGKGVSVIMPTLATWGNNILVIDPKGEAAENTVKIRERMGLGTNQDQACPPQNVYVIDPFEQAEIPDKYRATLNPLDALDQNSKTIYEDINVLADGIVMRGHDPGSAHWDDGAQTVIAGLIAFVLLRAVPENKNLLEVRKLLRNRAMLELALDEMAQTEECAGICQAGAARARAQEGGYFLSNADKNTAWLDSAAMQDALGSSSFSMSELKTGHTSVYLVLPANYLGQHGRFLRLFVRHALEEMSRKTPDGKLRDRQCLFLLDEFFSLGYIDEIAKAAGLMRGYGLQLWPVLQDLGQLIQLYGREGSETFFGNADLHMFFGNTDQLTLEHMSKLTGTVTLDEIGLPPVMPDAPSQLAGLGGGMVNAATSHSKSTGVQVTGAIVGSISASITAATNAAEQTSYQNKVNKYQDEMNDYQRKMSRVDRPRLSVEEIAVKVAKRDNVVADNMFCVIKGSEKRFYRPLPFFQRADHAKAWTEGKGKTWGGREPEKSASNFNTWAMKFLVLILPVWLALVFIFDTANFYYPSLTLVLAPVVTLYLVKCWNDRKLY